MKINLTYKEANLITAILWELGEERATVISADLWRLTDKGTDIVRGISEKLADANEDEVRKGGKDRDLSGSPKGTIQDARWDS